MVDQYREVAGGSATDYSDLAASLRDVCIVVADPRANPLWAEMTTLWRRLGAEVIAVAEADTDRGSVSAFEKIAARLRGGGLVCILADQDTAGAGVPVSFMNEKTAFAGGPAALALRTGAALLPVTAWFEPSGWGVEFHQEIRVPVAGAWAESVRVMTQELAAVLEAAVARHPEDWHVLDY